MTPPKTERIVKKTLSLFYIGETFYTASSTLMSSVYEVDTFKRSDWGFIQLALEEGQNVRIRQATAQEMRWAVKQLK